MGVKIQLLGIGIVLTGIAFSTNNIFGYWGGILGGILCIAGVFVKKN